MCGGLRRREPRVRRAPAEGAAKGFSGGGAQQRKGWELGLHQKAACLGSRSALKGFSWGGDKEYASLSALRRLPLDLGNPTFLHRAVQRV
ncbi:hypothetical protein GUJ93_ZPchr0010g10477 [Zizania palustris]|uniref:Uncharacterized protein n=1 Tax=Zizania palustris TaxID=103762 RepID=A0A8J5W9N1_ZIZPA|nr:hypothetical protein GUJ93_ZPchr0010g10477 [Zizania palustris]